MNGEGMLVGFGEGRDVDNEETCVLAGSGAREGIGKHEIVAGGGYRSKDHVGCGNV